MDRILNFKNLSLRVRIFLSMIFLTLIASVLIAAVSIYQFRKEAREYHQDRLERKEAAITEHINYVLQTNTYPLTTENIPLIFTWHTLYDKYTNFVPFLPARRYCFL